MNKIVQISKRAKAIRKAHPSMKWQTAIKKASNELKGKKVSAVSGSKKPAKRKVTKTKVKATRKVVSVGSHNVTGQLSQEISRRNAAENALARLRSSSTAGMTAAQKSARKKEINYQQKAKQVHAKNIVNLKRLI
jgi:hypothetical protein